MSSWAKPCCQRTVFFCNTKQWKRRRNDETTAGLDGDVRALASTTQRGSHSSLLIHIWPSLPILLWNTGNLSPSASVSEKASIPLRLPSAKISPVRKSDIKAESLNETVKDKQFLAVSGLKGLLWSKQNICNAKMAHPSCEQSWGLGTKCKHTYWHKERD